MLIAIIIGLVLVSIVATWFALRLKKRRIEYLQKSIRSLASMQAELLGRIQTFLGRHREEALLPQGAIVRRSKQLSEEARELLSNAQTNPQVNSSTMFISLKESWTDIEQNLSSALQTYERQVADFNSTIELIPASIVAKVLRYQKEPQLN